VLETLVGRRDGLVVARGRHGTTVADGVTSAPSVAAERRRLLETSATAFAAEARRLGFATPDALAAVRRALT
jgi:hypothetical protein